MIEATPNPERAAAHQILTFRKCYNCETSTQIETLSIKGECRKCAKHTDPRSWVDSK